MTEWFTGWGMDLDRDGLAVCDSADLLVGYATVMAPRNFREALAVYLEGRLRPDQRGRGSAARCWRGSWPEATELHAERQPGETARLTVEVPGAMTSLESLARRAGLRAERWYRADAAPAHRPPRAARGARHRPRPVQLGPRRRGPPGAQRLVHPAPRLRRAGRRDLARDVHRPALVPAGPLGPGDRGRRRRRLRARLCLRGRRGGHRRPAGLLRADRRPAAGPRTGTGLRRDHRGAAGRPPRTTASGPTSGSTPRT